MRGHLLGVRAAIAALIVAMSACTSDSNTSAPRDASGRPVQTITSGEGFNIRFQSTPDPPEAGSNALEVSVTLPSGFADCAIVGVGGGAFTMTVFDAEPVQECKPVTATE